MARRLMSNCSRRLAWELGNAWCFVVWTGRRGDRYSLLFVGTAAECVDFHVTLPPGTFEVRPWREPFVEFSDDCSEAEREPWLAAMPADLREAA